MYNHTTHNRRSYIDQGIYHNLTDREFHKNNQYILATQATQVFYLQDLARQPCGWKVVEHVYHQDVTESDQDVIHGSSSSHLTLSDFINNEDDVVAHVLDDDDVVLSDDDEVNPSTNVDEVLSSDDSSMTIDLKLWRSMLRLKMGNASLKKAFRENNKQPLQLGFDYADLGTFHPLRNFASMLNSLMGETVWPLPLACEWEEIPEAFKAHIYPTLESLNFKNRICRGIWARSYRRPRLDSTSRKAQQIVHIKDVMTLTGIVLTSVLSGKHDAHREELYR
ncbi:hypothetical protein Tco_0834809 [Tanacetum coccineum]